VGYGAPSQEPFHFPEIYEGNTTYTDIMRKAMRTKYSILRYYYTEFFLQSNYGGPAIYKPLWMEFPNDPLAYQNETNNVMIGDSLKVSVLANAFGVNQTSFYFPKDTWCNILDFKDKCFTTAGETQVRSSKAYEAYVHMRQGKIVPF